jgi:hypothetical protein
VYTNERYPIMQGNLLQIDAILRNKAGAPVPGYAGTEALTATVWPGGTRAPSFHPTMTWTNPAAAAVLITISTAQTQSLTPGLYDLEAAVDAGGGKQPGYGCLIEILAAAAMAAAPWTYLTFEQLRGFSDVIDKLLDLDADRTGFEAQRAQASGELDRRILERYNPSPGRSRRYVNDAGGPGPYVRYAPSPTGAPSPTRAELSGWLGTSALLISPKMLEFLCRWTLAIIYGGPPGRDNPYLEAAGQERSLALQAFKGAFVEIDTDADGIAELRVDQDVTYMT